VCHSRPFWFPVSNCIGHSNVVAGLETLTRRDLEPIAAPGSLAPASRTSLCWGDEPWPCKPDVVFEGGNYPTDKSGFVTSVEDLEILATESQETQCRNILVLMRSALWPVAWRANDVFSAESRCNLPRAGQRPATRTRM